MEFNIFSWIPTTNLSGADSFKLALWTAALVYVSLGPEKFQGWWDVNGWDLWWLRFSLMVDLICIVYVGIFMYSIDLNTMIWYIYIYRSLHITYLIDASYVHVPFGG